MKKIVYPAILCLVLFITACPEPYIDPDSIHTVTFSAEGGVFDNAANRISVQTDAKGRISNLPAVTRVEAAITYSFQGWYTPGGTRVTALTVFDRDTLVVAIWKDPNAGETDERGPFAQFLEIWMDNPGDITWTQSVNETLTSQSFEFEGLETPIVIDLNGTLAINTISLSGFGSIFTVGNNVTLRLRNIRLEGHGSNTASLIDIKEGGKVIIESGTVITNNATESLRHGGGVTVQMGGELVMPALSDGRPNTGMIYKNSSAHMSDWLSGNIGGGGVWVRGGKFTMDGGRIEENDSIGGGGVLVTMGGEFTMNGGVIFNCFANSVGGGVRVAGYRANAALITETNPDGRIGSTFTMTGGEITECLGGSSGGGVEMGWSGTFTMRGGKIYKNTGLSGGGVCNLYGIVLLYGGEIYENKALGEAGGLMNAGHCEIWGGDIHHNDSLGNGGGVMHSPTGSGLLHNFFMYDGKIRDNTAQGGGGGLYTIASFDMFGGEITYNIAQGVGGGVLVGAPSLLLDYGELTITNGKITDNTSYASGADSSNSIAVRGEGKARTAKLGIYWFENSFTETITEFTPELDVNGNYIFDEDGRPGDNLVGTSKLIERTFTTDTPPIPVQYFYAPKDEGGMPSSETKYLYFIPTPLFIPYPLPVTYEDRSRVQGSYRIAIGTPRVERIEETVIINGVTVTERDVIAMDMDAAKLAINENRNIDVTDGVATYTP